MGTERPVEIQRHPMQIRICVGCTHTAWFKLEEAPKEPWRCLKCRHSEFGQAVANQLAELETLVADSDEHDPAALGVLFLDQVKELHEKLVGGK